MKIFLLSLFILFSTCFIVLIIALNVNAQEFTQDEAKEIELLKLKTGDLLDSAEVAPEVIAYSYAGAEVELGSQILFKNDSKYSNIKKITDNKYQFFSGDAFYRDDNNFVKEIEFATTTLEIWEKANVETLTQKISKLLKTPYVLADSFFASLDGFMPDGQSTWNATRGNAVSLNVDVTTTCANSMASDQGATKYVYRTFTLFNTAALPDDAIISSAKFYFYPNLADCGAIVNADTSSMQLTPFYPVNPASIVVADFNNFTDDVLGTKTLSTITYDVYNIITLSNLGYISATGTTAFFVRNSRDVANLAPTGNNINNFYNSRQTGTNKDEFLEIEFTLPASPAATTTPLNCLMPTNYDISVITGCHIVYSATTSTSTMATSSITIDYYYSPFLLYLFVLSLLAVSLYIISLIL